MKTLFFIAALLGAVYLIIQTPAGKAWFEDSDPEVKIQKEIPNKQQISDQVLQSIEKKMTTLVQYLNQKQQTQINKLETRIAELENELIMGRVDKKPQQNASSSVLTLHPYKQPEKQFVALSSTQASTQASTQTSTQASTQAAKQGFDAGVQTPYLLSVNPDKQLQRKRQARLQDIAQKMEMSSLQALVN
jgi:hypothetical protein